MTTDQLAELQREFFEVKQLLQKALKRHYIRRRADILVCRKGERNSDKQK